MKKKATQIAAFAATLILITGMFSGCGSGSSESCEAYTEGAAGYEETVSTDTAAENSASTDTAETPADTSVNQAGQKLIITWCITMETETYEETVSAAKESAEKSGGYIESEQTSSVSDNQRYTCFTLRIPEDKADEWVTQTASYGTITNRQKSTSDAGFQYVDTESRLKALRAEQETLISMMEKATKVADLITIQSELAKINTDIESYESELRVLDNQVEYTTVQLDIEEVTRENALHQSLGEEIHDTFCNSIDRLKNIARYIIVGILGNSVMIIIIAVLISAVILIIKKIKKIHRKKQASRKVKNEADHYTEKSNEGRTDH